MRRIAFSITLVLVSVTALGAHGLVGLDEPVVTEPGFDVTRFGAVPGPVSGLAWGPDGNLYVTVIDVVELTAAVTGKAPPANVAGGGIWRLRPTPLGVGVPEPVVLGGRVPLGLTFGPDGTLYWSDIVHGALFADSWGAVKAVDFDANGSPTNERTVLMDLPNGVHQTNQLSFGPDGLLYVANGSSTDSGWHDTASAPAPGLPIELAQPPERFPVSGSILRFDPAEARDAPLSALRYRGNPGGIEDPTLDVVATGMRNNFGIEWIGDDLYVTFNGPNPMHHDDTLGDDTLLRIVDAPSRSLAGGTMVDFGWPGCLYGHDADGFLVPGTPERADEFAYFKACDHPSVTPALASFGAHASADGMAVGPEWFGAHEGDLFVALYSAGAQIARVELDASGAVATIDGAPAITPFVNYGGLIDVVFHEGSMWVAQFASGVLFGPGLVWKITPSAS